MLIDKLASCQTELDIKQAKIESQQDSINEGLVKIERLEHHEKIQVDLELLKQSNLESIKTSNIEVANLLNNLLNHLQQVK
jgi:hypothetical protein